MEILKASNNQFNCYASKNLNFITSKELISIKDIQKVPNVSQLGFLVVKNVINKQLIKNAREIYFNLFDQGEYKRYQNDWIHLENHKDSHGCNNHPSLKFIKKKEFKKIINSDLINKISAKLLRTDNAILCPRMIVRSFSSISERCTFAHRDKEYFKSAIPKNIITCWIPLGIVGADTGQLIYLLESHKKEKEIDKLVKSERVISRDLNDLSNSLNLKWYRPIIEIGDVIFHSLEIVHASFDSNSIMPRLSIDLRYGASDFDLDSRWSGDWRGDDGL